jgi:phosphoribosylanthranilate isomerase
MAKVKICGLTRMEDVEAVNRHRPDYAGFVFAPGRRQLSPENARQLVERLDPSILSVGVFVNEGIETAAVIAGHCRLGAVQLHGSEDDAYIFRLNALLPPGTLVIKAVRVKYVDSIKQAEKTHCGLLLLDAYTQGQAGGAGETFDWGLLEGFRRPYLLAGGLNAGNVEEAIRLLDPYGVDVSSGVETDGRKDSEKIAEFIGLARRMSV